MALGISWEAGDVFDDRIGKFFQTEISLPYLQHVACTVTVIYTFLLHTVSMVATSVLHSIWSKKPFSMVTVCELWTEEVGNDYASNCDELLLGHPM